MSIPVFAILVAFLGGLAIGFQNPLAAIMGQRIGALESAFVVHLGGALFGGVAVAALAGGGLDGWREVPTYAWGAGLLGVILVASVAFAVPRIGLAATVALIILGQLLLSAWLDHYGVLGLPVRSFDLARGAGLALLLVGAWLVVR